MMTKFLSIALVVSTLALSGNLVLAKEQDESVLIPPSSPVPIIQKDHLFEQRVGSWKATCDEMEDRQVYCRMFHIEQFGEWKTKNFIQLGPAWTPETVGFVVATYLGFKEGTTVSIGIDMNERYRITAPKGNNLMIRPEITEKMLQQMEQGHKLVITFNSYTGVRHLSLVDLAPYKTLLAKVKTRMKQSIYQEVSQ